MLNALITFSGSFATKRVYLNNKPFITRPNFIDLNPNSNPYSNPKKRNYYPFMISLHKCT